MKSKHILVLSVSAGAGHVRAAQALLASAEHSFPYCKVTHLDVMDYVPNSFRKIYADSYIKIIDKAPLLWAYLYQSTDVEAKQSISSSIRRKLERLNTHKLNKAIETLNPDAIVCTHFLPAELASRRISKGERLPPIWIQVTDFDVHGLWIHPNINAYFVANAEVAARLSARGIPAKNIHVTGIPIMPQFSQPIDKQACAADLGIATNKITLLMMSGGVGVGNIVSMCESLLKLDADFQIIALAGRNEKMLNDLKTLSKQHPERLYPMGFTNTIEKLMAIADIAITKPGGLTSSECLAMGLPMIVVSPIPGQEERNTDYLLESGVALKAVDTPSLCYKVSQLIKSPSQLDIMRQRMLTLAHPHAAKEVLTRVLDAK